MELCIIVKPVNAGQVLLCSNSATLLAHHVINKTYSSCIFRLKRKSRKVNLQGEAL